MASPGFKASNAYVEAVGHKAEQAADCGKIEAFGRVPNLFEGEQSNRNHKRQRQFQPEEVCLIAGFEDQTENSTVEVILEAQQSIHPQGHQQGTPECG